MPDCRRQSRNTSMRSLYKISLGLLVLPVGLFFVAGRPLSELLGLFRASAGVAVDGVVEQVPTEVKDRKLDNDMQLQRRQLTDHQVALNLSRRELDVLAEQVKQLEDKAARRQRLLQEAYPVLQQATAENRTTVEFAGAQHTLVEFQQNLDALLAEDTREKRQLDIRRAGLAKLTTSIGDGERALTDMKDALLALEQEVELLRTRREQAELEGRTLDLVSAVAAAPGQATTAVGAQAEQLRKDATRLEAGNEARRAGLPTATTSNPVARDWERLERLKSIHEGRANAVVAVPPAAPVAPAAESTPPAAAAAEPAVAPAAPAVVPTSPPAQGAVVVPATPVTTTPENGGGTKK